MKITITPGESLDLSAAPGAQLVQTGWNISAEIVTVPPPTTGTNQILYGTFTDAAGKPSLAGWVQDPLKPGWINTHAARPDCPGGFLAQADRDFRPGVVNVWKGGNPSSAWLETLTLDKLPTHDTVTLSWNAAHHMFAGFARWMLYGRNSAADIWEALAVFNSVEGVPPTKVCNPVGPKVIVIPGGGYGQYRLRWDVTLADDRDGVLVGDVRLVLG